jgi:hypothetical protein
VLQDNEQAVELGRRCEASWQGGGGGGGGGGGRGGWFFSW